MFNELSRKIQKFSREGSRTDWVRVLLEQVHGLARPRSRTWFRAQESEWSLVVKAKGRYVGGEGRWDRVWDRLDLETHQSVLLLRLRSGHLDHYPYLHGHPEREPSPPLHPWVCDYRWERVLQSLSACTDGILTVIWGKGLLITVKNWFLQSYCVDNFKTFRCFPWTWIFYPERQCQEGWGQRRCSGKQVFF